MEKTMPRSVCINHWLTEEGFPPERRIERERERAIERGQ